MYGFSTSSVQTKYIQFCHGYSMYILNWNKNFLKDYIHFGPKLNQGLRLFVKPLTKIRPVPAWAK